MATEVLLVFLRYPEPGRVKTRLIPALGAEGAARAYRHIAEQVVEMVCTIERPGLYRETQVDPASALQQVRRWLNSLPAPAGTSLLSYRGQVEGDLGARLTAAFATGFAGGAERVVAIGTDCIELDAGIVGQAYDLLQTHDAVLGPAHDGGYYLIGLSRPTPEAFRDIPWSCEQTAAVTLQRLRQASCSIAQLPVLRDIDTAEDLWACLHRGTF